MNTVQHAILENNVLDGVLSCLETRSRRGEACVVPCTHGRNAPTRASEVTQSRGFV